MFYRAMFVVIVSILAFWYFRDRKLYLPKDLSLKGRRVLITGASQGTGEYLAYEYAKQGANVFITARRENRLKSVLEKCTELGVVGAQFGYYVADMTDYKTQSKAFVQAGLKRLGGIDTVIVNHVASASLRVWLGSTEDLEVYDRATAVMAHSYVHIVSHALPHLRKSELGGRIGVIGSTIAKIPFPLGAPYAGAKFLLDGFFSSLRLELKQAESGITVMHGVMGGTDTEGFRSSSGQFSRLNITEDMLSMGEIILSPVEDTANQIMVATETGVAELYHPPMASLGYISIPTNIIGVIRGMVEVEIFSLPKLFYDNYMKYNA